MPVASDRLRLWWGGFLCALLMMFLLAGCGSNSSSTSSNNNGSSSNNGTPGSSNPGGTGGEGSAAAEYVYAAAGAANDQSSFAILKVDPATGNLTQVASATIPVRATSRVRTDASGRNVYVTGGEAPGTNMDLVKVDPAAGTITAMPGQTFQSAGNLQEGNCCPSALAVDSSGTKAYVGGLNDGAVHAYTIDLASGTWTQTAAANQTNFGEVYNVAITPNNQFLYTAQRGSDFVSGYSAPALGTLPAAPYQTGNYTSSVSVSADGKWAFVPHYETATMDVFKVNADGSLTLAKGGVATGNSPFLAVTDPQSHFVFLVNSGGYNTVGNPVPSISVYTLDSSTGALTQVPGSPFPTPQISRAYVDPSGKYLYAGTYAGGAGIYGFSINQTTGALTPLNNGAAFATQAADIAVTK